MSILKEGDSKEFEEILKLKKNALVMFGAPWCNACKLVEPQAAELSEKFTDYQFVKIDVSKNPGLASKMGVMSLPNIFIIKEGKIADQIIGATNKNTLATKLS